MRSASFVSLLFFLFSCTPIKENENTSTKQIKEFKNYPTVLLTLKQANMLVQLPLKCVQQEYPNKLGQVLANETHLGTPKELHPAFYGCFDWHSSVHGHWSIVSLLKQFPELGDYKLLMEILKTNLSKNNIEVEVNYLKREQAYSFERTYGWAWLLKLAEELHTWNDSNARVLEQNLKPLTDLVVLRMMEFIPKLNYPLRVGTHTNTAFGMSFASDYAKALNNDSLQNLLQNEAMRLFYKDENGPLKWEPSGTDFLSPCLQEVDLMRKVMSKDSFLVWIDGFLPQLKAPSFDWEVGLVSDREDGHLVHLDGLNFSRAWCLKSLSNDFPIIYGHLDNQANKHINYSIENLVNDSYEGGHWLASFALYSLE